MQTPIRRALCLRRAVAERRGCDEGIPTFLEMEVLKQIKNQ